LAADLRDAGDGVVDDLLAFDAVDLSVDDDAAARVDLAELAAAGRLRRVRREVDARLARGDPDRTVDDARQLRSRRRGAALGVDRGRDVSDREDDRAVLRVAQTVRADLVAVAVALLDVRGRLRLRVADRDDLRRMRRVLRRAGREHETVE